jgi:hypothetical protein
MLQRDLAEKFLRNVDWSRLPQCPYMNGFKGASASTVICACTKFYFKMYTYIAPDKLNQCIPPTMWPDFSSIFCRTGLILTYGFKTKL